MKKVLLASTALAGASLLATSAGAGTPVVSDNQEVTISGNVRFSVHHVSQDIDNAATGGNRGYKFDVDESEVKFAAEAVADNGLEFGLQVELLTQPGDGGGSDEAWVFLQYENAGRVELGDQDGAADRMVIEGKNAMAGRGGYDGPVNRLFNFGNAQLTGPSNNQTGDATKITYFTPRFGGFQAGASWTPDTGQTGGNAQPDNNGNFEDVISAGVNYQQTFNNVGITVAAVGEWGDGEAQTPDPAQPNEGVEQWVIGGKVDFAGFSVAAGYGDRGDTGVANGGTGDAGQYWDVGASYATGPWKIGAGAFFSEQELVAGNDVNVDIYSVGATFNVAAGLDALADINFVDVEEDAAAGVDNNGYTFVFSLNATF